MNSNQPNQTTASEVKTPTIYRQNGDFFQQVSDRQEQNPSEDGLTAFIKVAEENPDTLSHIPDAKQQIEALKVFKSGGMSYAEMRGRCG